MKKYRAYDIEYDTDGMNGEDIGELPKELFFEVDDPEFDPAEDITDLVSDRTGWCIFGCQWEEVP